MTDLLYTITIEVEKPIGTQGLFGPVIVAKINQRGRLYHGQDPAAQLGGTCAGLVADIGTKLRQAAHWTYTAYEVRGLARQPDGEYGPVPNARAELWSVFGRLPDQSWEWVEDVPTKEYGEWLYCRERASATREEP